MPKMLIEIDTDTQVVVPRVTSVSSEMKAKFIGEFSWSESLEDYDNAIIEYIVPWWVCKEIFHRMAQHWISAATQPAPIPTGWQPIETAPKDGTAIIVGAGCYPVQPSTVIWVSDPSVSACAPGWFINYKSKTMFGESIALFPIDYDPTHWQPLPLPPAPGGEE